MGELVSTERLNSLTRGVYGRDVFECKSFKGAVAVGLAAGAVKLLVGVAQTVYSFVMLTFSALSIATTLPSVAQGKTKITTEQKEELKTHAIGTIKGVGQVLSGAILPISYVVTYLHTKKPAE
jgi:hypothetical protein